MLNDLFLLSSGVESTQFMVDNIRAIVDAVNSKRVHTRVLFFLEDKAICEALRAGDSVTAVSALTANDAMRYSLDNPWYDKACRTFGITDDREIREFVERSLSRYLNPSRDDSYDDLDYDTRRVSVIHNRIRSVMNKAFSTYNGFVICESKTKSINFNVDPKLGDGRFIYTIDLNRNSTSFLVGGSYVAPDMFITLLGGDTGGKEDV